jgi:hypothetical protein
MPLQNRVTPWGQLEAVTARGAWMGNRGILHDGQKRIVAPWRTKAWITCRLDYKGVHRVVFSPHTWTELFFLDEATAFAAGHRPCSFCRHTRFDEFKTAWGAANHPEVAARALRVAQIDAQLHAERALRGGGKVTWTESYGKLPPGTFIALDGAPCLIWNGAPWPWTHAGYHPARSAPGAAAMVTVLTPRSIVAAFRCGLTPQVHASATNAS